MIEIEITKHEEDDAHTVYDFCTNTASPGRLRLDRTTGQVAHLNLCGCPGDPEYHGRRAGRAVWQRWKSGTLPEKFLYERD